MGTENRQPPGGGSNALGIDSIEQWLADVTGLHRPMTWIQLAGGHSNLTFRVEGFDGTAIVVRRPPVGRLQHAAHDMHREFRVISALWPTEVSVPKPIAITEDPTHTDAPTYAMQWVEGRTPYSRRDIEDYLDLDARDRLSRSFIDTLAALHSLDPDTVGLGDLGKRTSYLERQLHSWHKSLQASSPSGADERLERIHRLLVEHRPPTGPVSLVHGDYGLHNCRVTAEGDVAAVIDWEISTLGDPLADLAYCVNAWVEDPSETEVASSAPTSLPGFWGRQRLLDRYADATGADLSAYDYYRCFNQWKLACIVTGVVSRYENGNKESRGVNLDRLRTRITVAVDLALEAADNLSGAVNR